MLLLLAQARAATPPPPSPPLCRVDVAARQTLPGFYRVQVTTVKGCPKNGRAFVRLESFVGGTFPRDGFFEISPDNTLTRSGIPCYWRVGWRGGNGQVWTKAMTGAVCPEWFPEPGAVYPL